jgi:hypothetical protein
VTDRLIYQICHKIGHVPVDAGEIDTHHVTEAYLLTTRRGMCSDYY